MKKNKSLATATAKEVSCETIRKQHRNRKTPPSRNEEWRPNNMIIISGGY